MPTATLVRTHRASIVSDAVARRIGDGPAHAFRVQSVYRSAVNIRTPDGLLTLASPAGGGLPNGILADLGADWRTLGVEPGMAVTATDGEIRVPDAGLAIRIAAAPRWSPRFRTSPGAVELASARWRRRTGAAALVARARASGAGLAGLLGGGRPDDAGPAIGRRVVERLVPALRSGDRGAAARHARELIGLGPGLTPSGDDVLVGIEAALHALAHPSAGFVALALDAVELRTTELAATYLRHAAAGEFAERLHALVGALVGSDDAAIPAAIARSVAWGATSGTDCLVGVLIGLDVAADVRGAIA
jgi:hypothetical protein